MASINLALSKVKRDLSQLLDPDLLRQLAREQQHHWRQRVLDPAVTLLLMITQMLHGNIAIGHLRRVVAARWRFSDVAYCQARARLPLALLRRLMQWVAHAWPALDPDDSASRFHGHRVLVMDGSGVSMPDTAALQQHFGQPGNQRAGCGFPVTHLLLLMHVASGMILDLIISPLRTHDMRHAADLHRPLSPGDLIVGDRAFCSFAHLALLHKDGLFGLFRLHQRVIVNFGPRRGRRAGNGRGASRPRANDQAARPGGGQDQVVKWVKQARPRWLEDQAWDDLPDTLPVRVIRCRVRQRGFRTRVITLATNLLDQERYSAAELAGLYQQRWQIETNLRHLKTTMKMDVLRCKSVAGVTKELLSYAIAYNLVRLVMAESSRRQGVAVARISFIDAQRWLLHHDADDTLAPLRINPHRPGRVQPRAIKRRPKKYPHLNRPRRQWVAQLLTGNHIAT